MKKLKALFFIFSICSLLVVAQKAPLKYGKVSNEELEMKVYPLDTSATAVVLYSYGYFSSLNFQFTHQVRIKILKEEGKSQGNFFVPANEKAEVRGQIVNLENGKPVVTKLDKKSIFIEKVTRDIFRARVAFPNVKVGSVIDVEFYYTGLPNYWNFQQEIPVRWSELVIEPNQYVTFRTNLVGPNRFDVISGDRWVAKNVPAFVSEPYIDNKVNYITRYDIELSSIHVPGGLYKDYATSWGAVAESLSKETNFGLELATLHLYFGDVLKKIKQATKDPEEQLKMALHESKNLKWNNNSTIWISSSGLSQSYNKKIGNCSEVNLNLVLLLRKLDIDANPILLSTRSNGILPRSASFDKLNYVAVQAIIGEKTYLLDATEEYLPVGMLPERALNGRGLLLKPNYQFDWVDLVPTKKDKTFTYLQLVLNDETTLKGEWTKISSDYAALDARKDFKTFNSNDDYLKSIEDHNLGLSIENYSMTDFDSIYKPLSETFSIVLKNRVIKTNNKLFVSPIPFDRWTENPFKAETRAYPIDFTTPTEKTFMFQLAVPEGYSLEQLPKNVKMTMKDNAASIQMISSFTDNNIQVLFKCFINKPTFQVTDYLELKAFFDELVKKQSEMIILKKIENAL